MRHRARVGIAVALAAAIVGLSGCYTLRSAPLVPVPLYIGSSTVFLLHAVAPQPGESASCRVLEAEGGVAEIRGDTVVFARISRSRQPQGAPRCVISGRAFVVATDHPELRSKFYAQDGVGSALATLLLVPVVLVGVLVIAAMAGNGGW